MITGGGKSLIATIKKGDFVRYFGEVYEVVQVYKHSDFLVIKNKKNMVYAWSWKCRKV